MLLTFKKTKVLSMRIFIATCFSCSKNVSESAADKVAGTYKGNLSIFSMPGTTQYGDYIVKVEHPSREKIRVSCVSSPKGFDDFEGVASLANNTITYGDQNISLFYQTTTGQIMNS